MNTVVDVESYNSDGVIEEPSTEETEPETTPEETEPTESETDGYEYTEDAFGNILTESFIENGLRQTTTYTYSADGNYLVSKTDMNGNTVQYQYNLNTGVLESLIDANGNETAYTYNAMRELQNVHMDVSNLTNGTGMDVSYTYLHGRLMELTYGDYHYEFTYDIWGNVLTVTMNEATLVSYDYGTTAYKNEVNTLTYGNGQRVFYTYNALGQVATIGYTDQPGRFQYAYSADGALASIYDSVMQETTVYTERGYEIRSASNTVIYTYETDEDGNKTETINGLTFQTNYTETGVTIQDGEGNVLLSSSNAYDAFSRIIKRIASAGYIEVHRDYFYSNDNGMTGDLVDRYDTSYRKNGISTTLSFQYSYDGNGNIIGITKHEGIGPITDIMAIEDDAVVDVAADGINIPSYPLPGPSYPTNPTEPHTDYTSSYRYDEAGQLVEVIDGEVGKVYRYTYDASGNISTMYTGFLDEEGNEIAGITRPFTYVNGILASVGSGMTQTTYETDSMGNPVKIISSLPRTEKNLTWGEGRMLLGISTGSNNNISYTYNADGLRNQQVVTENGVTTTTKYIWGDNGLAAVIMDAQTIVLLYDDTGEAVGFFVLAEETNPHDPSLTFVTQETYTYVKNLQGDVIRILDSDGNAVVKYTYDPWGVPTVYGDAELAAINPCSYRGYYYDEETGYYYLQSRYYDPQIGRFINTDSVNCLGIQESAVSNNLFVYCCNNTINNYDPTGYWHLDVRADVLVASIDLLIYLVPMIPTVNKFLKRLTYVPKYATKTYMSTIKAFLIRVLPKVNIGLAVLNQLVDWIDDLTGVFPFGASIGGLIVWGLSKIFATWTTSTRAFGWFGPVVSVTYIRIF